MKVQLLITEPLEWAWIAPEKDPTLSSNKQFSNNAYLLYKQTTPPWLRAVLFVKLQPITLTSVARVSRRRAPPLTPVLLSKTQFVMFT